MHVIAERKQAALKTGKGKWLALTALMAAQFMVVIDIVGLNVALPSIQRSLHFSNSSLEWVISAYQIAFGGCLLLGGRIADLFGRKRMFLIGAAAFATTSLLCGLAQTALSLILFRALQGLAAAILSPTSLSSVTRMFPEGRERNIALGIWGAVFGAGGAIGSLLSGLITTALSWQWFFFLNLPLGLFAMLVGPKLLPADPATQKRQGFDIAGAVTVSAGSSLLLYALGTASGSGWSWNVSYLLTAGLILWGAFIRIQRKTPFPLIPKAVMRIATMRAGVVIGVLAGSYHFSMFFLLTLYMQNVLHLSAFQTALGYLSVALPTILIANLSSRFIKRFGVKTVLVAGQLFVMLSLVYLSSMDADGNYLTDLFPALLVGGIGWGLLFPSINIMSFSRVDKSRSGIAAGIITMSEQLGGAIGLTLAAIVAASQAANYARTHAGHSIYTSEAMTAGFSGTFQWAAALALLGFLLSILLIPSIRKEQQS